MITGLRCPACNKVLSDSELSVYDTNDGHCNECQSIYLDCMCEDDDEIQTHFKFDDEDEE